MTRALIPILCVAMMLAFPACRPEQTTREGQRGARSTTDPPTGGGTTPRETRRRVAPRDYSLPPGDPAGANDPASGPAGAPGELKGALADLDRILVRQRKLVALWQTVHTLADARRHKRALIEGALEILRLTISSLGKAVKLSKADLARFLERQQAQRAVTKKLNEAIKAQHRTLAALPGGKAFFDDLKQTATQQVGKHTQTLMLLGRELLKRQGELQP
jgi:hypothetical protein